MNLRQKLASFGFESNDDFDFPLRCVLEAQHAPVRAAELVGQVLRRNGVCQCAGFGFGVSASGVF